MQKQKLLIRLIGNSLNATSFVNKSKAAQYAFKLFTTPRKGAILRDQAAFLNTAEQQSTLTSKYGRIQTYTWNEKGKQSILLLHGWESNSARWQNLIEVLVKANYRVMAIDAPGHGNSYGPSIDIVQYAEAVSLAVEKYQPTFLIGHSLGGATLTHFWAHFSTQGIQGVILLASPAGLEEMMLRFQQLLSLNGRVMDALNQLFLEKYQQPIPYFSSVEFAKNIQVPSLIIHDEEDPVTPVQEGKAIHQSIPKSRLILTQGLGHSLQDQRVYSSVLSFLKQQMAN